MVAWVLEAMVTLSVQSSRVWIGWLGAAIVGGLVGACQGSNEFVCQQDDECSILEVGGTCQPDGYCSFPDDDCPSGQRYGMHAGGGLAGMCVGGSAEGTDGPTTSPSSSDAGQTSLPDTSDDDLSGTLDEGSTTPGSTSSSTSDDTTGIPADWWDPGFGHRIVLEIDPARVPEDLIDFPLMVDLTAAELSRVADPGGADLRFVAEGALIAHELERFDASRGSLLAWVRVPVVSSQDVTSVVLYFGNPAPPMALDPTEVWEPGYSAVFHAADPGAALDSTAWHNDGVVGADVQGDVGPLGDAYGFVASEGIDVPSSPSLAVTSALTLSAWGLATSFPTDTPMIVGKAETFGSNAMLNDYYLRATDSYLVGTVRTTTETVMSTTSDGWSDLFVWHHVALTCDGSDSSLYLDGVPVATVSCVAPLQSSMHPLRIGWWGQIDPGRSWDGAIDEVRVSSVARSEAWISAEFANQSSPQTFYTVGPVESL